MIVNAGNEDFSGDLKGFLPYVDKSNLLTITNRLLGSRDNFFCVSRPRRFGKTMAAEMLNA